MFRCTVLLVLAGLAASGADLVTEVRAAAKTDFSVAESYVHSYEKQLGRTPESVLAWSWLGREALAQKQYGPAEKYAVETYQQAAELLKKRPIDQEPRLPLAVGASIEVQSQVMAAEGHRGEAVSYLQQQLSKFNKSSMHARIQKNINLLSLEGKAAPAMQGVTLPKGKPALLFFWAHWCPDCRAEAPILERLKAEFGPRGLVMLGPTQKYGYIDDRENVPAAEELRHIEKIRQERYAAIIPGPAPVSEANFLRYGVSSTPTMVLVDRAGIVRLYHPGSMTYEDLRAAILKVM